MIAPSPAGGSIMRRGDKSCLLIAGKKVESIHHRMAKRITYGYRDEDYFFSLIRFISIPSVRFKSLKKT